MRDTSRLRLALPLLVIVLLPGLAALPTTAAGPEQVTRAVTLSAARSTAFTAERVGFSGTLSKSPKGSKVRLQQKQGSVWKTLTVVRTTTKKGAYAASAAMPSSPGAHQFRALAPARKVTKNGKTRKLKKATSGVVTVTVKTRPTPPVTPVIATAALPDGEVGDAYVADLELVTPMGGAWSVDPALPAGLALDASTGGLSGTPTADGSSNLTFSFTPTAPGTVASKTLSLLVAPASAPTITTTHLADGYAGQAYSQTLTTDDPGPGTWSQTGAPVGITLDATTGELSGTSALAGDHEIVVSFTRTADGISGDKTFTLRLDTVPVPPVPSVRMAAGGAHACRILTDASLWCWGSNEKGALGIGAIDLGDPYERSPQHVGSASWLDVSAATEAVHSFTCGIQADRSLWCWGGSQQSQLGLGDDQTDKNSPELVDDTRHWAAVSGGQSHACATTLGGRLFCWGGIAVGTAGVGGDVPTEVDPGGTAWASVSAGGSHTCGIRVDGTLWCWGYNSRGQLGTGGSPSDADEPVQVGSASNWSGLSAGAAHSCALRGTDLYCWGRNLDGAVGSGTPGADVTAPAQVAGSWARVAASGSGNFDHTCGIDTAGRLWCWGAGEDGRLGTGTLDDQAAPTQVGADTTWQSVTTGGAFGCAVKATGSQWCWGGNGDGELGIGSHQVSFPTPQELTS